MAVPRARAGVLLSFSLLALLVLQDHVTPTTLHAITLLADTSIQHLHPAFLVGAGVSVEVNHFTVVESDSETLFDEHVAFFLLGKSRLSSLATFAAGLLLSKRTAIIDELGCVGKMDCSARLTS